MNFAAQKWADSLAFMDDSLIRHPNKKYSQNLWMVEKIHLDNLMQDDLNPVKDWYNERIYYSGHFDNATFPKYGNNVEIFSFYYYYYFRLYFIKLFITNLFLIE